MSTAGSSSGASAARRSAGAMVGRSPCTLTTISRRPSRIDHAERLEDAVGAGRVVGPRHHRPAAGLFHSRGDGLVVGGHHDPAEPAASARRQHMHDHRLAGDIGQRLAGQPGRGHAGRDQDDGVGHCRTLRAASGKCVAGRAYTGCQRRGKPAICAPPRAGSCGPAPVRPFSGADPRSILRTQQRSWGRSRHLPCPAALNIGAGAMFTPRKPEKPGYAIAVQKPTAGGKPAKPAPAGADAGRLASADAERARAPPSNAPPATPSRRASPNRVGPNLCGMVGRAKAPQAGFNYSAAMKAQTAAIGRRRARQIPDQSAADVPGTAMTFAGVARGKRRADVITYPERQVGQAGGAAKEAAAPAAGRRPARQAGRARLRSLHVIGWAKRATVRSLPTQNLMVTYKGSGCR